MAVPVRRLLQAGAICLLLALVALFAKSVIDNQTSVASQVADGRTYLEQHGDRYDAIFLDAFRQPYIPFYLTTQEFWSLARDRLDPHGMVMANVGRVPGDNRLPDAIAGTMATRFATVVEWPVGDFNVIVAGFDDRLSTSQLIARLGAAPPGLDGVRQAALDMHTVAPSDDPLTDDRAPVEWLTDQMIVRYAAAGGTGK